MIKLELESLKWEKYSTHHVINKLLQKTLLLRFRFDIRGRSVRLILLSLTLLGDIRFDRRILRRS